MKYLALIIIIYSDAQRFLKQFTASSLNEPEVYNLGHLS